MAEYVAVQTPKAGDVKAPVREPNPRESASWLSIVGVSWMTALITRGAKAPLTEADTWPLPASDMASPLHERFSKHWETERLKAKPRIHVTMWHTFRGQILWGLTLYLAYAGIMLLQPILIQSILQYLQEDPVVHTTIHITNGYVLAALLTVLSFFSVTLINYAQYANTHTGCNAKLIAIDMVFYKTLRLSGFAKQEMTTGEVVTLASVDAERLFLGFSFGYWALIAPVMLLAVFIMIGNALGAVVGVCGGAVMLVFLYIGYVSGRKVGEVRRRLLKVQADRVKLTNEVLQGIRVVKLYAWEASLQAQLATIRDAELALLKAYQTRRTFNTVILYIAPVISLAVSLLVYVARGDKLTAPIAFTALAYMNIARFPCTVFSTAVMMTSEMVASCQRISKYLASDEVTTIYDAIEGPAAVELDAADFSWAAPATASEAPPLTLRNISLTLVPGTLTIVVGPVGSGKSSLMSAILGEIQQVGGQRHVNGRMSYVNQEAWIQHATLKNNILFNSAYDDDYYNAVLAACQLKPDLAMLPEGDATEIGERGINLSGGQKARVSLARGVYHRQADIYLLDDPLSALDVHVATAVFHECIKGLLAGKTTVLVLNSHYHFLPLADRVVVLEDGAIVGDGAYESLKEAHPHLMNFTEHSSAEPSDDEADATPDAAPESKAAPTAAKKGAGGLMDKEDRAKGSVTAKTYKAYFGASGASGVVVGASIVVFFVVSQTALSMTDWYMSYWSSHENLAAKLSSGWVYLGCALASVVLVYGRSLYVLLVALQCSKSLHSMLFEKVVGAPVPTFFDVTPMGRILNRFSSDLDQTDSQLPYFGLLLLQFLFQIGAVIVVCAASTPWILVLYAPLFFLFYKIQQYYNKTSGELKRLESISRTPVVTLVSETLGGLSTIRAFGVTNTFLHKQRAALDHYVSFSFLYNCSARWFQMRLDWLSSSIIAGVAFICVLTKASIGMAAAGLTLTYASQLSGFLSRMAMMMNTVENLMTSVERLSHYETLENEDDA
ncbi:canalicular multispecific organic anion transporter, partial [Achlya hypogyna]